MSEIEMFRQLYSTGMWRGYLALVALLTSVPTVEAQDRPKVLLTLPSGIASETVQIDYFLTGPFGGYGGFVRAERKKASYDIEPFVDGRPAENVKIIAYLPGCEIDTLDLTFSGTPVERWLDCYPLGSVSFRGQISPASTTPAQSREIEVNYLAMWSHRFFGIADGPVTTIRLGTVRPERDGKFEIALPDFYKQSSLRDGAMQFILRDPKTGNIIAFLRPADATPNSPDWLTVLIRSFGSGQKGSYISQYRNCRKQALSPPCAFYSPFEGSISEIEILRQLRAGLSFRLSRRFGSS